MAKQQIKITIPLDGETKIEVLNGKGANCKLATKSHEEIYDDTVSQVDKPELYKGVSCSIRDAAKISS